MRFKDILRILSSVLLICIFFVGYFHKIVICIMLILIGLVLSIMEINTNEYINKVRNNDEI